MTNEFERVIDSETSVGNIPHQKHSKSCKSPPNSNNNYSYYKTSRKWMHYDTFVVRTPNRSKNNLLNRALPTRIVTLQYELISIWSQQRCQPSMLPAPIKAVRFVNKFKHIGRVAVVYIARGSLVRSFGGTFGKSD